MEWVYLVLILAFISWSVQIILVFRRQSGRVDAQIAQFEATRSDVAQQAEQYENQAREKKETLQGLEQTAAELEKNEKELQTQISGLKGTDAARRPTRHKVEAPPSDGDV
ncbi:MAG: hypothetical protein O2954_21205 [bacterium]|nr:hypothetical protein [bacterium]